MTFLGPLSKKQREAAARRFLAEAAASFNGRPAIPVERTVELKSYGTAWSGPNAIRVVLVADREAAMDYQLRLEEVGPCPESVVIDQERGAQLRGYLAACLDDFAVLQELVDRTRRNPALGGGSQPTEREIEVLRLFRLENAPAAVMAACTPGGSR